MAIRGELPLPLAGEDAEFCVSCLNPVSVIARLDRAIQ
jgi:hypothetical protein